jgi:alpha-beta hydrolase superfamily lysophospholipase
LAESLGTIASWTTSDGYEGYYRWYAPTAAPKGIIVCLHGIQSHGGWYEYSCGKLAEAGYVVAFLDRRGSGLNFSHRGDVPSFYRLFEDVVEFIRHLKQRWPNLPVALAAVSWGGKLAVGLCRYRPQLFQAMMLLCPGFFPQVGVPPHTKLRIGLARLLRPSRFFEIPLNEPALFTASWTERQFLRHDPLALHYATARFLVESVRLDRYIRSGSSTVTMPVLLMLAGQDQIIRNAPTRAFIESFATKEKTILEYPEAHHTLEFEENRDQFIRDQIDWLSQTGLHERETASGG